MQAIKQLFKRTEPVVPIMKGHTIVLTSNGNWSVTIGIEDGTDKLYMCFSRCDKPKLDKDTVFDPIHFIEYTQSGDTLFIKTEAWVTMMITRLRNNKLYVTVAHQTRPTYATVLDLTKTEAMANVGNADFDKITALFAKQ